MTERRHSIGAMPLNRSTVSCINVRPQPSMSMNCFGHSGVLSDKNRLPIPPAMITMWLFRILLCLIIYRHQGHRRDQCILRALTFPLNRTLHQTTN